MSGVYYCTLTIPDAGQHTGAVVPTQNMICSTAQPVFNVTRISHPIPDPVWLNLAGIVALVIVAITVAIWRTSVVTSSKYRNRKDRQMAVVKESQTHAERMAELEVKRQQAIAAQIYPPLPEEQAAMRKEP